MTDLQAQISLLDLSYQKLSGLTFSRLEQAGVVSWRERGWYDFIQAGHTLLELEEVILWIKKRIHQGKRDIGALRFRTLIAQLDVFEEELAMARAEKRNLVPAPSDKERVLALTGRPARPEPPPAPRVAKAVIEQLLRDMRKASQ